ncbi:DNA mismatch repair protein Mlh3 [Papilio xuthus]|uniref:DNA mismatch repair protein Mlh3 n=1 Tax=Papilio xuthus TaxID=66420 RepID=A0A194QAI5_PAPXU|nr:DNA mismatch repair protein Mlh3 [Papilio xuthus]
MIIKKLPTEVQTLLNASSKINNYKNAVEELVYNSLDADATSVAVRINIYDNTIQVIDNGFGIAKCDIPLLGQRYASSKVTDKSELKSAPIKFGFRGESLSNIIEVSQCVKITTRHKDANETWIKTFYKGQYKGSQITLMRPSKGTTVELKGFLYNLHIQKKATNPLNELQNIKLFLQQLSLVNTNVSISLRDNSKNEIIFKVHKNRDTERKNKIENTREEVRKIMEKVLGNKSKGHKISQLRKGVKGDISKAKENFNLEIDNTIYDNYLNTAHKVKTPLKAAFKKKKQKMAEEIDPIMKQCMKETAFEMYSEKLAPKTNNTNKVQSNLHICDTKESFLQSGDNIHSYYEHKLAFNGITPLNKLETDYLKSSDLLKTVINSQKVCTFNKENTVHKPFEGHNCYSKVHEKLKLPTVRRNNFNIENDTSNENIEQFPNIDYSSYIRQQNDNLQNIQECLEKKYSNIESSVANIENESTNLDYYKHNKRIKHDNNIETNITSHIYKSLPKLTFESHKFNLNDAIINNKNLKRFISKQSKENFNLENNIHHTYVTSNKYKSYINQHYNSKNKRKNKHPYLEPIKNVPYFEHKSSHTIEFSTKNMYNAKQNTTDQWKYKITGNVQNTYTILDSNVSLDIATYLNNLNKNKISHDESVASYLRFNLSSANDLFDKEKHQEPEITQNLEKYVPNSDMPEFNFSQKTDEQIKPIDICEAVYHNNGHKEINDFNIAKENAIKDNITNAKIRHDFSNSFHKNDVMSRYFYSIENVRNLSLNDYHNLSNREQNSKEKETNNQPDENQNDNCYVLDKVDNLTDFNEEISRHFQTVQNNQILQMGKSNNVFSSEEFHKERNSLEENLRNRDFNLVPNITRIGNGSDAIEVENNDVIEEQNVDMDNLNNCCTNKHNKDEKIICNEDNQIKPKDIEIVEVNNEIMPNVSNNEKRKIAENFVLQSRHNFVPKGMSPIFENCNNKNVCSYNFEKDYFQDDLYNNFANDVLDSIKIYENKVSNINEEPKRINIDPNCLKFDTKSLKDAKVLGQVDRKFIVAELRSDNPNMKHLVLFDQHAVHERIRLEENLSDYKNVDQWNSINCETISLKLSKDHVLYLNNFKDKFKQLGLDWKIENDSLITINAVPKAIFGKYCRQADVIIQSIKNLIIEEIKAIKSQGGNTLLYPKSIMDLVFSEACRYAIKFGDKLSKGECASLISSLSSCRTPFQCAHGRPVLAVLSDLKPYEHNYKVFFQKLMRTKIS